MTQQEIADGLGITQQMVSKLARMGMTLTSVEAARQWRKRNVDPTRSKDRFEPTSRRGWRSPDYVFSDRLEWTGPMIETAREQLRSFVRFAEKDFDGWKAPVRMAMALLPSYEWDNVDIPLPLWVKLVGECELAFLNDVANWPPIGEPRSISNAERGVRV